MLNNSQESKVNFIIFTDLNTPSSVKKRFLALSNVSIINIQGINGTLTRLLRSLVLGRNKTVSDLIKFHRLDYVIESGDYYGWRLSKYIISWIPDLQHVYLPANFSLAARAKRDFGFLLQRLTRNKIYLSSYDALNAFSKRYLVNSEKLHVVRFSVGSEEFKTIKQNTVKNVCNKYRIQKKFIYFPGQFWTHKNHSLLIEALSVIKQENLNLEFQLVCSGNTKDYRKPSHFIDLQKKIESHGLTESDILLLGQIPFNDVQALMVGASAVINPSLFEGWSTTVEEARSLGKILILSNLPIHIEQGTENTYYFESESEISLSNTLLEFQADMKEASENDLFSPSKIGSAQKRFYDDFTNLLES